MNLWLLVITVITTSGTALDHYPFFSSKYACEAAGVKLKYEIESQKVNNSSMQKVIFVCVPTDENAVQ